MRAEIKDRLLRVRWWMFHLNRRQIRRWFYKATRPASYPYISGDGFRRFAQHIFDETNQTMNPRAVGDGDVIFVSTEYAYRFLQEIDPGIRSSYCLVTHNSDVPADERLTSMRSDKVRIWFALNNTLEHPGVIPIPIGLENLHHQFAGVTRNFNAVRANTPAKKNRVLSGFTIATNPGARKPVLEIAQAAACVDQLPDRLSQEQYLPTLAAYKFLICPPGNGLDTHRTWEAMYVGVIPIVADSVPMRAFAARGLPLWILPKWELLLDLQEDHLQTKYEELKPKFRSPALWMPYWRDLIRKHKNPVETPGEVQSTASAAHQHTA